MNPERWQKLNELFHAALDCEAGKREGFVADVCKGDEQLRRDLQSMLTHYEQARSFIESPPYAIAADTLVDENSETLVVGAQLGHYKVRAPIAKGGMGEVYLAQDTELGRAVALKILPKTFFENTDRLRRFEREARAASTLNHPNIVTIYEIGKAKLGPFIAMELVEGRMLREIIDERPPAAIFLQLGRQIAAALRVAHEAGIVHRDIKPENIIVRSDGYVKVFDFGLAKVTDRPSQPGDTQEPTIGRSPTGTKQETNPGMVMGTIFYMSPEQAQAEPISNSTDIFSLGVVLYELATGQHPFKADSPLETLHSIISLQPFSPSRWNPEIPRRVEGLILQMLEKEPSLRPTAAEIETTLAGLAAKSPGEHRVSISPEKQHTVGREKERTQLREAFHSALAGRCILHCVAGEPGIGKTTLVEDFLGDLVANDQSYILARGRCSERLAGTEAYLPLIEALDGLVRGVGGESVVRAMKLVAPTWYALMVPAGAQSSASDMAPSGVKAASQERMKRELGALLEELTRHRPMVLFIDDLHWADISTVDFLPYLVARFESLRLMVIATYRPSDLFLTKHPFMQVKLDLQTRTVCKEIHLEFLSRENIQDYLDLEFPDHSFPSQFPALIHSRTEGSPLFMVELLRYLRDRKVIIKDPGWMLTRSVLEVERDLPESVRSMVQRKIDQLSEADRQLLLVASVQGYEFDSAVLAKVLSLDPIEVEERLETLDRVHSFVRLLREQEFPDLTLTLHYRFVHLLYQNALYASLTASRKASLSASVARVLENYYGEHSTTVAAELALLFEVARDFLRASDFFLLAARNAARVSANQGAIELARRGLALLEKLPDTSARAQKELTLYMTLGVPLMAIKGYGASEVEQSYSRARELCQRLGESPRLFLVVAGLWAYYMIRAELKTARELAEQGLRLAQTVPAFLVQAHWMFENTLLHLGEIVLAREYSEQGTTFYDPKYHRSYTSRYGHDPNVARLSHSARILWLLGYPDQALRRIEEALSFAEKLSHRPSKAFALFLASYLHECRGEWSMTQQRAEAAISISRDLELANWPTWSAIMLGRALAEQGQVEEGIALIQESLTALRVMGSEISRPHFLALLAESLSKQGSIEEALIALEEALTAIESTKERYFEAELYRLKGNLLLKQLTDKDMSQAAVDETAALSEPEKSAVLEAEKCLRRAIEIARKQSAKSLELRAVISWSRLLKQQGKPEEARRILAEVYGWFTEGFETADLKEGRMMIAELETTTDAVQGRFEIQSPS